MTSFDRATFLNEAPKKIETSPKPGARRWDHHLNLESRGRGVSTLKETSKASGQRGLLSLGTGRPLPEYFPWYSLTIETAAPPTHSCNGVSASCNIGPKPGCQGDGQSALNISQALSYGDAAGASSLLHFITDHVNTIHRPPYADWQCSLTAGTTSAIEIFLRMFCERGDSLLVEQYTYPGTLEAALPLGIKPIGVGMDDEGLIPQKLDEILTSWDKNHHAERKPRLLYIIPTGQNPTGITQPLARRRAIYDIAEKHDLLIIEDDPYYYLQLRSLRQDQSTEDFLQGLPISYLSLDTSGRVLRLDSTSKILAPGLRCGWVTGPEQLVERFLAHTELSTVSTSGVSQLLLSNLMCERWGQAGLLEWLEHLSAEYRERRDKMLMALEQHMPKQVCSWKIPDAGMFLWVTIRFGGDSGLKFTKKELEDKLFEATLDRGVVYSKGSWFQPPLLEAEAGPRCVWLRLTYVAAKENEMEVAVAVISGVIKDVFCAIND
jgi:aromatic amino acid aminotransferase I / 2-aminoadipate transaminase